MHPAHVDPSNGHGASAPPAAIRTTAPATGEPLAELTASSGDEVREAVARARRAQGPWGVLSVDERCERVLRFRDALVARGSELVDIVVRECGKPRNEALLHELAVVADAATYYCKHAPRILAPSPLAFHLMRHRRGKVVYAPRGVVGIISPWNFPLSIPLSDVFAALVTGSAVVVKPSELASLTMLKAKDIYDSTGLPEDLFNVVLGGSEAGSALIGAGIQRLIFTGGVASGRKVAAACGENLVPCVLELGGKAPLVACADADVERTAQAIVYGGFANAGQVCVAVERVYAHKAIYDALKTRVAELAAGLRVGDPSRAFVDVGALTYAPQLETVERLVKDALAKGAELLSGGRRKEGPGRFFEPTVLAACTHDMAVMREEIFGPVVPIQRVESDDEAVRLANDSHLGLNAYVFTRDRAKGERLAERIAAGTVVINDVLTNYATIEAPFGGVKQSGFGRVHGDDALREMAERKVIDVARLPMPAHDPLWYPYTETTYTWAARAVRGVFGGGSLVRRLASLLADPPS